MYDLARPEFEKALSIRERILGYNHPDTITSRAWLADMYQKLGKLDKAEPLMQEIVAARECVLGEQHPDLASALNNRAQLLRQQVGDVTRR